MEIPGAIADEVVFMRKLWRRHAAGPVRRVLDVACGNSPHGQILARKGVYVAGIDRSAEMIAAGKREGARLGDRLVFYRREIERFRLPEGGFDSAFFMSETFPVMVSNGDVLDHLRSVGRALRKGALYFVDIDRHNPDWPISGRHYWRRRKVRVGDARVEGAEYRRGTSWDKGVWIYELCCRIEFPDRAVQTRALLPVRYTLPATV
jgi:SAM-dependent methyltransferase